jgi:hypothetical protein
MSTVNEPMKRKEYEKALRKLQVELCALQDSAAPVEAQPHGPLLAKQVVRLLAGARYHV